MKTPSLELIIRERSKRVCFWAAACLVVGLAAGGPYDEGFTFSTVFSQRRESWADIEAFKVLTYSYLGIIPIRRMVVYRYVKGRRKSAVSKALGWINGWDAQLPGNFGMKARELAGLLEECRIRANSAGIIRAKAS